MSDNTTAFLAEIATELLANELERRAKAKNMTVAELVEAAGNNWDKAEQDAENLLKLGHEGEV